MATRSAIGIKNEKGDIKAIYCHWDGYPEYNGRILEEHYTDISKINELISLGDISSLAERIKPNENEEHTWDNPANGVTVAYHRDRGERLHEAETCKNVSEMIIEFSKCGCEYFYVFENSKWYVYTKSDNGKLVKDILRENNKK